MPLPACITIPATAPAVVFGGVHEALNDHKESQAHVVF